MIDSLEERYKQKGRLELDSPLLNRYIYNTNILFYLIDTNDQVIYSNLHTRGHGRRQEDFDLEEANKEVIYNQSGDKIGYLYWQIPGRHRFQTVREAKFIENVNNTILLVAIFIAIISLIISLFLSRYLSSPLLSMNNMASAIADGNYQLKVNVSSNNELSQLGDSLNQMSDRLKYLERVRDESTGDLIHELRTPLAIISNYLSAIKDGIFEADTSTIEEIEEELHRLERLISSLDKFADTEKKLIYRKREEIDLNKIIKQSINNFTREANEKGIKLLSFAAEDEILMSGDKDSLKMILNNLISNAIKYSSLVVMWRLT